MMKTGSDKPSSRMTIRSHRALMSVFVAAAMIALSLFAGSSAQAQSTWNGTSNTVWTVADNWSSGVPTGSGTANFTNALAINTGITGVGWNQGVGSFYFDSALNYSIGTSHFYPSGAAVVTVADSNTGNITFISDLRLNVASQHYTILNSGSGLLTFGLIWRDNNPSTGNVTFDGTGQTVVSVLSRRYAGSTSALFKNGSGTLTITGTTTVGLNPATVNAGTIRITSGSLDSLGAPSVAMPNWLTLNGGALQVSTLDLNINNANAGVSLGAGGGTFNVDASRSLTIGAGGSSNIISGAGQLTKTGDGTLTLAGDNTYTGATAVNAGALTLIASQGTALQSTAISIASGAALNYNAAADTPLSISTLTINGGTGTAIGGSIGSTATSARINVSGAATVVTTSGADVKVNVYFVSGATPGTYTLISGGTGSTLDAGTYTLGTVVNNTGFSIGTIVKTATDLTIDVTAATALSGNVYWKGGLAGNTGVWAASDNTAQSNWQVTDGVHQPLVPGAAADLVFSTATDPGTMAGMTLGANISVRTLAVNNTATAFGLVADGHKLTITPASSSAGITIASGVQASTIGANVVLGADQTWTQNSANALTVNGVVSGTNSLTKAGTGTLILSGANTYTGDTTISGGSLTLSGANTFSGNISIGGGTLTFSTLNSWGGTGKNVSFTGSGTLTPTVDGYSGGQLSVNGGTATISGNNLTFASTTGSGTLVYNVTAGGKVLNIGNAGSFTGTLKLKYNGNFNNNGATQLQFSSLGDGVGSALQFESGQSDSNQGSAITLAGDVGPLTFNNRQIQIRPRTASNWILRDNILANNNSAAANKWVINTDLSYTENTSRNFILGGINTGDNAFNGLISNGSGTISLVKIGTGRWVLSGKNTYTGTTLVSAGTLVLEGEESIADTGTLNINGGKVEVKTRERVQTLQFAGTPQAAGRWGSSAVDPSKLDHPADDNRFTGTGVLFVDTPFPAAGTVLIIR